MPVRGGRRRVLLQQDMPWREVCAVEDGYQAFPAGDRVSAQPEPGTAHLRRRRLTLSPPSSPTRSLPRPARSSRSTWKSTSTRRSQRRGPPGCGVSGFCGRPRGQDRRHGGFEVKVRLRGLGEFSDESRGAAVFFRLALYALTVSGF